MKGSLIYSFNQCQQAWNDYARKHMVTGHEKREMIAWIKMCKQSAVLPRHGRPAMLDKLPSKAYHHLARLADEQIYNERQGVV